MIAVSVIKYKRVAYTRTVDAVKIILKVCVNNEHNLLIGVKGDLDEGFAAIFC